MIMGHHLKVLQKVDKVCKSASWSSKFQHCSIVWQSSGPRQRPPPASGHWLESGDIWAGGGGQPRPGEESGHNQWPYLVSGGPCPHQQPPSQHDHLSQPPPSSHRAATIKVGDNMTVRCACEGQLCSWHLSIIEKTYSVCLHKILMTKWWTI